MPEQVQDVVSTRKQFTWTEAEMLELCKADLVAKGLVTGDPTPDNGEGEGDTEHCGITGATASEYRTQLNGDKLFSVTIIDNE